MSEIQKGKTLSEEQRKKISMTLKGRKLSDVTRKRMSDSKRKKIINNNGNKHHKLELKRYRYGR